MTKNLAALDNMRTSFSMGATASLAQLPPWVEKNKLAFML